MERPILYKMQFPSFFYFAKGLLFPKKAQKKRQEILPLF